MHVLALKTLREFWQSAEGNGSQQALTHWHETTEQATWRNLSDVRKNFRHADLVGICTVFNIKGNDFRLVTLIGYEKQKVYVLKVMTHKEYDKGKWKNDCKC